jgi:Restriction endonuclease fold toxin 3
MSEGELAAAFEGLANDAGQAGGDIAESIARFTDDTANIEDANVDRTLAADAKAARAATDIGKQADQDGGAPGNDSLPLSTDDQGGRDAADLLADEQQYSGALRQVNKPDLDADALANRIGGQSRVRFENDPKGREFDAVSDEYIGQAKPTDFQLNKNFRTQAKATFRAARATGRSVYYHFDGPPQLGVIEKLNQYAGEYGVRLIIDTQPFL